MTTELQLPQALKEEYETLHRPVRGRQPVFKSGFLTRHLWRTAFTGMLVVMSAGCALLPFYTSRNAPLPANGQVMQTRARTTLRPEDLPDGIFVGVAVSGGGSRAANVSAAAFFELEKLGVLPHRVAAISSVSGGSVTAATWWIGRLTAAPAPYEAGA